MQLSPRGGDRAFVTMRHAVARRVLFLIIGVAVVAPAGAAETPPEAQKTTGEAAIAAAPPARETVFHAHSEFAAYGDTDAVTVFTPSVGASVESPVSGWSASGYYLVDVVSAASVDIVSTASNRWQEVRHVGGVGAAYKPGAVGGSLSAGASSEPDYTSLFAGGTVSFDLAKKTLNPTLGYAYTHDTAGRTGTPFSVYSQILERHTASAAVEFVLSGSTALSLGVDAMFERGDQTKPYRFIPLFTSDAAARMQAGASVESVRAEQPLHAAEATPHTRNRMAFSGRFAKRFGGSTLILTERLYADDWGLLASTTDLRFAFDLSRRMLAWFHVRGHAQRGVSFWRRAYVGGPFAGGQYPRYRTGDREMSPLAAFTLGGGLQWELGAEPRKEDWILMAQGDFLTTSFSDALFIERRQGYLGVLQLEAQF
jgi:hypothetical protein